MCLLNILNAMHRCCTVDNKKRYYVVERRRKVVNVGKTHAASMLFSKQKVVLWNIKMHVQCTASYTPMQIVTYTPMQTVT